MSSAVTGCFLAVAESPFDAAVEAEDYETAVVIVGESVGRTNDVVPAATVVERMVEEAEAAMSGLGG